MAPIRDLERLLRELEPRLHPGIFVFATVPAGRPVDPGDVVASVREDEGLSVVVAEAMAERLGLAPAMRCAWITLGVPSDLAAVGLTAAVAAALAGAGIPCNVVAGTAHDHLFVPIARAADAMAVLRALSRGEA